ncbi:hypothetical protein ACFSQD_04355 [Flavihumibacter stibioxidans]|uniref:HTH luxR-type domain-containing protein n=1 Tax=Flavihumibacter stibioxidans TaxID=1834163 RepID=A0ABR7M3W6_9BACT|nr:hypothetical protein [Flavihumibacter stibioxidans]MBC6489539.1 hypothetical protein [Flavihumibacter stibioxidans]
MRKVIHSLVKHSGFLFLLLLSFNLTLEAASLPAKEWVEKLDKGDVRDSKPVAKLVAFLSTLDSSGAEELLKKIEAEGSSSGNLFQLRLLHTRCWYLQDHNQPYGVEKLFPLLEKMTQTASESGDKELIAYASWVYGSLMYSYKQMEPAVTYSLKAVELYAKLPPFTRLHFYYSTLGEMLFHTHEYPKSIRYTLIGLEHFKATSIKALILKTKDLNTIGQGYQHLGLQDSALYYYRLSYNLADSIGHEVWKGINASYEGQVCFDRRQYDKARSLLHYAYTINKGREYGIAANSLQWLARIHLLQKNTDSAAICLDEALRLLYSYGKSNSIQVADYLQGVYATKADLHRMQNRPDSVEYYQDKYMSLHDSLQRVATLSSSQMALLRIDNERNQYLIQSVKAEKKQVEQKRNFIIIGISLLAVIITLILIRQKEDLKHRTQLVHYEKKKLEAEMAAAKDKLELFTQNLLEKSTLLEQLQTELRQKELTNSQQELLTELTNHTILTEEDWNRFRSMFEKVYPGFFMRLKQLTPDITLAEQRMAALTRLGLPSKQMAAMLGISVDGVHKTRQRLRQRLQVDGDTNLEQYLTSLEA